MMRRVFMTLSSRSLAYAAHAVRTLLANSIDPVHLRLIADDEAERRLLSEATAEHAVPERAVIDVVAEAEVADRIADRFPGMDGLRRLHAGHPCWRKIIDPIALSAPDEEIVIADPDLFFPNRFVFEPTPADGVMMMRQGPNCLVPPHAVRAAFDHGLRLANHVDIGVAQMRAGAVDPEWLDWAVQPLVADRFRDFMHIEAIVWSAIAMRIGGRHLDPAAWRCWERGVFKRVAISAGVPGRLSLRLEPQDRVKCMHLGGPSKRWVEAALAAGDLAERGNTLNGVTTGPVYAKLTRAAYEREQRLKTTVWKLLGRQADP